MGKQHTTMRRFQIIGVGFILTIVFPLIIQAQNRSEYPELTKYRNWSIIAGPVVYNKAEITPQFGNLTIESNPMLGFNAGVLYDFYPERKWSFQTGLIVAKAPIYSVTYKIPREDLYSEYLEDLIDSYRSYALYTFSFPFLLQINLQTGKKSFASFATGFKTMYFPHGGSDLVVAISNEELADYREIFGLKLESPENSFQGSFVIGTGYSYALEKVLLKANIIYAMTFQNTISGEYQFAHLFTSPDSRGYYDLSGNYLGLLFSASLKKGKNKN